MVLKCLFAVDIRSLMLAVPGPRPAGFWGRCKADCTSYWSGQGANVVKQKVRCQWGSQGCWRPRGGHTEGAGQVKVNYSCCLQGAQLSGLGIGLPLCSVLPFSVTHCSSAGQMLELNLELYIEMPYLVLLFRCTFPYTAAWLHMTQICNEQQPLTNRRVHRTGFFQRRAE